MNQHIARKVTEHFATHAVRMYEAGEIITFAGDNPQGVALLLDGVVEQYDITPEGNKVVVNIFKPASFFPMSWAINRTPNAYFFAALTDVRVQWSPADQAVDFLHTNPDVMFDLLSRVYKGTDALLKRLVVTASGIAASRLVFELLIEAYRFGAEVGEGTVVIQVKQMALAERSGLARETVSRELNKLQQSGVVTVSKRQMTIDITPLEGMLAVTV